MKRTADEMLHSDDALALDASAHAGSSSAAALSAAHTSSSHTAACGASSTSAQPAAESSSAAQRRKISVAGCEMGGVGAGIGPASGKLHHSSCASSAAPLEIKEIHMESLGDHADVAVEDDKLRASAAEAQVLNIAAEEPQAAKNEPGAGEDGVAPPPDEGVEHSKTKAAAHREAQVMLLVDELVCDICLEIMVNPAALTPCQHVFCWSCTKLWMQDSSKCPTCSAPITQANLNHKLSKLAELAVTLAPEDRVRPEEEVKAAQQRLEQHKIIMGSTTIRASARPPADDVYRPDLTVYWPCLACRPGNRSGFQCTHRIPDPPTNAQPPARGAPWPSIDDADEDGLLNVEFHDSCSRCCAWVPSKAPGIQVRCFACMEVSCQAFDPEGECPEGFSLYKLDSTTPIFADARSLFQNIPLAGFNEVEKELMLRYMTAKSIPVRTILAGIVRVAKRVTEEAERASATGNSADGGSSTASAQTSGSAGSTFAAGAASADAPPAEPVRAEQFSLDDMDVTTAAKLELIRYATRWESIRRDYRYREETAASRPAGARDDGTLVSAPARNVVPALRIEGDMASILTTYAFCVDCLQGVVGAFAVWWWMEEREKALKEIGETSKPNCSEGIDCRQTSRDHIENKNHICMPQAEGASSSRAEEKTREEIVATSSLSGSAQDVANVQSPPVDPAAAGPSRPTQPAQASTRQLRPRPGARNA